MDQFCRIIFSGSILFGVLAQSLQADCWSPTIFFIFFFWKSLNLRLQYVKFLIHSWYLCLVSFKILYFIWSSYSESFTQSSFTDRFLIGSTYIDFSSLVKRSQTDVDPYGPYQVDIINYSNSDLMGIIRSEFKNRSYEIKSPWTWDESEIVDKTRNRWQMGVGDIDLLLILKMEII